MLKNFLITALRNLRRNKVYTTINVLGLALGIGCSLVIYQVIRFENSFDRHHEQADHIYRIVHQNIYPDRVAKGMGTPHPVAEAIKSDFPEIKQVVRTHYQYGDQINVIKENGQISKFLLEEGVAFVDQAFFELFATEWLAGDPGTALSEPGTVVISRSIAEQFFGLTHGKETEAISQLINYNGQQNFRITGVIADPPRATNFPFKLLFEYSGQGNVNPYFGEGRRWNSTSSNTNTYILASEQFDPSQMDQKLIRFVEKYHKEGASEEKRYLVQPLSEVHFDGEYGNYTSATSRQFLNALTLIGIFLVVTACINFVNLATAQAANRAKEVGIRKAIGSVSGQLVGQFFLEIALITLLAVAISLAIAELLFLSLSEIIGHTLSVGLFSNLSTPLFILGLFVTVSLLSGLYPAVLLSRINTVTALRKTITTRTHSGGLSLRKGLVVLQFAISQFLIISTLIISSQTDYFTNKNLGFQTKAILTSYLPERDVVKMERLRQELLGSSAIESVTFALSEPTGNSDTHSNFNYAPLNSKTDYEGSFKPVDEYYVDFFEIPLLAGRGIQKGDSHQVVINRKIADLMGFQDNYAAAMGEKLTTGWNGDKTVVGVMENFHTASLEEELDYVFLLYNTDIFYSASFKVAAIEQVEEARKHFEQSWEIVFPEYVLNYDFYDQQLAERYESVQNTSLLMRLFTGVSILIGCLGLYGLIAFIAMNRLKEVGVRKILGASVTQIFVLFAKEIVWLLLIGFLVVSPVAFYFLNQWLDNFAFRITIGPMYFVLALVASVFIALVTISHKTILVALINPAETLKTD